MAEIEDPIWSAVLAAEDAHGEGAEDHARSEAGKACRAGNMIDAAIWDAAAHALHVLHSINRTRARSLAAAPSALANGRA